MKAGRGSQPRHLEKKGEMDMKINKTYVLNHRNMDKNLRPDDYRYCDEYAGISDIASLIYRTSDSKEIGEIPFGEDGRYKAHLIAGMTPVPGHYSLVLDTQEPWLWLYDDNEKTLDLYNKDGFQIYRAGEMGLLIRFK